VHSRDLDAFVACYTREAVIEDADGGVQMSGRDEIRKSYGELFESRPNLRAEILSRIRVGSYVVDEEEVSGLTGDFHAIAIYTLDHEGFIGRVRVLR
jgi:hypothetical protein